MSAGACAVTASDPVAAPIVRFAGVSKSYNGQTVLRDLDLSMRQGEFLTLLGPSGCGKTTSLSLVAGLVKPDTGTIFLRGAAVNAVPPRRRGLGLVFQSYALFPHMTVFENVAYGLRVRAVADTELRRRVGEVLDLVRLPAAADKYPSQLSGGMQQRVALARALVTRPDLLLLDEPLSNLDAALRKEMQAELRRIHTELHVSTLLVTHSQEEALVMSDRIAVMRQGRIECLDVPDTVYNRPPTRFVCTFLGDANLLDCTVAQVAAGEALLTSGPFRVTIDVGPDVRQAQRRTIAVRPESVVLRPANDTDGIRAVVRAVTFKGSHIDYRLMVQEQEIQALALPPVQGSAFGIGDTVRVHLPRERIILLAPEEAPHAI
jgi:ABC-type Fe3+/spermidine/putrescine transport system ATPase subunit